MGCHLHKTNNSTKKNLQQNRKPSKSVSHQIFYISNPIGEPIERIMRLLSYFSLFLSTVIHVEAFAPQWTGRRSSSRTFLFMSTEELSVDDITLDAAERMEKSVDAVKTNLSTIRTGRASANMLDRVKVDYYGTSPWNRLRISVVWMMALWLTPSS